MIMETPPEKTPMPKKSCVITLMFAIKDDAEALAVKAKMNEIVKDLEEKRYSFQITEI